MLTMRAEVTVNEDHGRSRPPVILSLKKPCWIASRGCDRLGRLLYSRSDQTGLFVSIQGSKLSLRGKTYGPRSIDAKDLSLRLLIHAQL